MKSLFNMLANSSYRHMFRIICCENILKMSVSYYKQQISNNPTRKIDRTGDPVCHLMKHLLPIQCWGK